MQGKFLAFNNSINKGYLRMVNFKWDQIKQLYFNNSTALKVISKKKYVFS